MYPDQYKLQQKNVRQNIIECLKKDQERRGLVEFYFQKLYVELFNVNKYKKTAREVRMAK